MEDPETPEGVRILKGDVAAFDSWAQGLDREKIEVSTSCGVF